MSLEEGIDLLHHNDLVTATAPPYREDDEPNDQGALSDSIRGIPSRSTV